MSSIIASNGRTRVARRGLVAVATAAAAALGTGVLAGPASADPAAQPDASANYTFQTVDNPQDLTFNQLLGINNVNVIAGYFGSGKPGHPNKGYVIGSWQGNNLSNGRINLGAMHRSHRGHQASGAFQPENFPGSAQTQVTGLNNSGTTVGFGVDTAGDNFGFYSMDGRFHKADYPTNAPAKPSMDQLLGVNDHQVAVGFYTDSQGMNHGYTYNIRTHRYGQVHVWGDSNVTAAAVNNLGDIAGFATGAAGQTEGFLRTPTGRTWHLDFPGAASTQALGVNDGDEVVGTYTTGTAQNPMNFGFVWSPGLGFQTVNDPNGVGSTTVNGVNDRGTIVGFYTDAQNNTDGFVGRP
ncbi:MAG: hypothetical protein FWD04_09240 [Conexibacteraceae bacterium]|nr:hypothetical protein [Conexibacteraceae bacterium]